MRPIRHGVLRRSRATRVRTDRDADDARRQRAGQSAAGYPGKGRASEPAATAAARSTNGIELSRPSPLLPGGPYGMDRSVPAQRIPQRSANAQRPTTR
jgi:hypothetical protein